MIDEKQIEQAIGTPLYKSKNIPICITSSSLKFMYVNAVFCEVSGYSKIELIGKSIGKVLGPKQLLEAIKEHYHYSTHGENKKNIWRVSTKRGKAIVSKIESVPIIIAGKKYTLTFTLDYTELDKKKELLETTEQKYRLLTETMPHIIWTNDVTGKPIYMNKVALKFFGATEGDFDSWDWLNYFDIEDARALETEWDIASQMKNPVQKNSKIRNTSGEFKWFQIVLYPQYDEYDKTLSWTAIATDIDDRIKAEQKLMKANKRLRSLIDASPIPIYTINEDGIIKDLWNPAAERILGWKKEEVIGKKTPMSSGEFHEDYKKNLTTIKNEGQLRVVTERKKKDGSKITFEINSGCIYDHEGNIDEIMITLLDITELEYKKIHLEESLKEKKTLLQEIHHRVKNNLAIVVSLLQLQVYQSSTKQEKNKLLDAQNRVMSIAMVHELLYSTDEFSKVNLNAYYDQLIETIKANMLTGTRGVAHELSIGLDSLNINQAIPLGLLVNELVTNSLKYAFPQESDNNCIHLEINSKDHMIHVVYSDNGVGFDMGNNFSSGLGFKIMDSLLQQLEADYHMDAETGFSLKFTFQNMFFEKKTSEIT